MPRVVNNTSSSLFRFNFMFFPCRVPKKNQRLKMKFSTGLRLCGGACFLYIILVAAQIFTFTVQYIYWSTNARFDFVHPKENPLETDRLRLRQRPPSTYQGISKMGKGVTINLATIACGRVQLVMNMLKTAVLFSQDADLHIIIFTDKKTMPMLQSKMIPLLREEAKKYLESDFTYEIHQISFPDPHEGINWRRMYADCTNQRLFFPSLLPHIDSLIYLDADTLIVGNLSNFWAEFSKMNEFQLAAATQNQEFLHDASIYNPSKGHPYFGPRGLNAGVLLMNLTRMRDFQFEKKVVQVYKTHRRRITLADQDMLNILFHSHPESMMSLSCIFNFYWIHCPWKSFENQGSKTCRWWYDEEPVCFCHDIYTRGVYIIHGNSRSFHKSPGDDSSKSMFPWIYKIWHEYRYGDSLDRLLLKIADQYEHYNCYMSARNLIQNALTYFTNRNLLQYYKSPHKNFTLYKEF